MTHSKKLPSKPKANQPYIHWEFDAIGTKWWLGVFQDVESAAFNHIKDEVRCLIEEFDKTYSRFRADSLVSKLSKEAGSYEFPESDTEFLNFYRGLYKATSGAFTPMIGQLMADAGYDDKYSLESKKLAIPDPLEEAITFEKNMLKINKPVLLDFGAAGKGYLVDIIGRVLQKYNVNHFCLDASGDMLARNTEPLRVGLENPDDTQKIIGVLQLKDGAICGSASNRRVWGGYHHIMDPFALESVKKIKAVWVIAKDAMTADGIATALFFVSPEKLKQYDFEYLLINENNDLQYSKGFNAELFI